MTENQKKQIIEMRKKGIGYKAISTSLGLSRDIVRTFCKARNMTGFGMAAVLNVDERISSGEICPNCCKSVRQSAKGRRKKFCSEKCRREWWKAHPENTNPKETAQYHLTCVYCGNEFISYGNDKRKFCSHSCYIHNRFYKNGEVYSQ